MLLPHHLLSEAGQPRPIEDFSSSETSRPQMTTEAALTFAGFHMPHPPSPSPCSTLAARDVSALHAVELRPRTSRGRDRRRPFPSGAYRTSAPAAANHARCLCKLPSPLCPRAASAFPNSNAPRRLPRRLEASPIVPPRNADPPT